MNVREIAYRCLCDTLLNQKYANLSLRSLGEDLSEVDKSLATQLVYGTLRNYRYVRYQWSLYVKKAPTEELSILLDMSTYQLYLLDKLPSYAVVNEAVEIAKGISGGNYVSLVNAVLRKVAENGPQRVNETDEVTKMGVETSQPDWLIRLWLAHYGKKAMSDIAWDCLNDGKVALRANTLLTSEKELLQDPRFSQGDIPGCLYYDGNVLNTDYFRKNLVIIQSESSQQVVQIVDPRKNERILDMCAAPGTKTVQMAMAVENQAEIYAFDVYQQRVDLIKEACEKYGTTCVNAMCADSRKLPVTLPLYYFDKVLLDAPCSGLGTLKHKPEIKINLKPEDIDEIVQLQSQLLDAAALMVKNGGHLTYSTCTLNKKENEKQIESFLLHHNDFELVYQRTIFPYENDSDGFYIAIMYKSVVE